MLKMSITTFDLITFIYICNFITVKCRYIIDPKKLLIN